MDNFVVYKSSAGSGKTYTLMVEYLSLALKYTNAYSGILAITFTNKAANEIKQRIVETLKKLALLTPGNVPENHRQLVDRLADTTNLSEEKLIENANKVLTTILHNYSDFAVSTIDSFMHKVIRSFAFDLKLSMNFEIELDTKSLLNAAVDELISKVGKDEELTEVLKAYVVRQAESDEGWDITDDLKSSASALFKEKMSGLIPALEKRSFSSSDFDKLCHRIKSLDTTCREAGVHALRLMDNAGLTTDDFAYGSRGIGCYFVKVAEGKPAEFNSYMRSAVEEGKWLKKETPQHKITGIADELKQLVHTVLAIKRELKFLGVVRDNFHSTLLLKKINDELNNIRQNRNVISISDFNNLIGEVVLDQPVPFIYLRVGEKFRHFMIDEFQDTSRMQWENLLPLIENSLANSRLSMIVGDGKQAIYRFKNGDAEQFVGLPELKNTSNSPFIYDREQLLKQQYDERFLETNYRSRQEIVEFNNDFFTFAAPQFIPSGLAFYKEVNQQFKPDNTGGMVHLDIVQPENTVKRVIELVNIARNDGYQFGDIAILTRVNKDAVKIAEALRFEGIKVVSSESLLLSTAQEVNFLINWVGYLADSEDKVALQGIIEHILLMKPELFTSGFYARRPDKAFLVELLDLFKVDLRLNAFEGLSFYDSIELIIRRFSLVSRNPVYIRFFLDEVLEFTQKNSSGASGFLEFWNDNCSKLSVSIAEQIDAVQILTVHKSKGLDFPVVIYAFPDMKRDKGDLTWDNISVALNNDPEQVELLEMPLVYQYSKNLEDTPLGDDYLTEQDRVCLDKFNLYYVAFTRASERLYVVVEDCKENDPPRNLAGLVSKYIARRNNEKTFGSGGVVKGKYKHEAARDAYRALNSIDLAYNSGDWVNRITLAKRSPAQWTKLIDQSSQLFKGEYSEKTSYGTLVHEVLSEINTFEDRERAVDHIFGIMNEKSPELRSRVLASLQSLISLQGVMPFFSGGKVIKEQEIMTPDGECYRPDRIVINDDHTYVIDFKTGLPNAKHSAQVLLYVSLIRKMDYPEPAGYIIYLGEQPQLVKVDAPAQTSLEL